MYYPERSGSNRRITRHAKKLESMTHSPGQKEGVRGEAGTETDSEWDQMLVFTDKAFRVAIINTFSKSRKTWRWCRIQQRIKTDRNCFQKRIKWIFWNWKDNSWNKKLTRELGSVFALAEERICELEDRSIEILQSGPFWFIMFLLRNVAQSV